MIERTFHAVPAHNDGIGRVILAQLGLGLGFGLSLAYLGLLIGRTYFAGDPSGFGDIVASLTGLIVGYPLGTAVGTWLAGRLLGRRGSLALALVGGYSAVGAMLVAGQIFWRTEIVIGWVLMALFGLIGAMAGYYLKGAKP
ncbi:MAG: hypothetical protein HC822_25175 [Oscillochloris sp.]|nr:hypothetical protein [Oscillochloris sp.]